MLAPIRDRLPERSDVQIFVPCIEVDERSVGFVLSAGEKQRRCTKPVDPDRGGMFGYRLRKPARAFLIAAGVEARRSHPNQSHEIQGVMRIEAARDLERLGRRGKIAAI